MQKILIKNKVFLLGLLGSLAVVLKSFIGQSEVEWKAIGFAALMAVLSFVANQWRGKSMTIYGVLGTLAYTFVSLNQTNTFSWKDFILSALAAVIAAVVPPPKPESYEEDPTIVRAKQDKGT